MFLAVLKFTLYIRLTLNSQVSTYFCLPCAGIKDLCYHAWHIFFILVYEYFAGMSVYHVRCFMPSKVRPWDWIEVLVSPRVSEGSCIQSLAAAESHHSSPDLALLVLLFQHMFSESLDVSI